MGWFKKILPDSQVQRKYIRAGMDFGDAASYFYFGETVGFNSLLNRWSSWEQEYSKRGYRTISLDDFIEAGGYGEDISNLIGVKREADEQSIIHSDIFRKAYQPQKPAFDIYEIINGEVQTGTYHLPSTKHQNHQIHHSHYL